MHRRRPHSRLREPMARSRLDRSRVHYWSQPQSTQFVEVEKQDLERLTVLELDQLLCGVADGGAGVSLELRASVK